MRIRLKKGKQRELILDAKKGKSWKELSILLGTSHLYLCNELGKEKRTLSEKVYKRLKRITGKNYDKFIIDKLDNNWGRSKGGINSIGNTKEFDPPKESEKLAEFFGIILGDGNIDTYSKGKKVRCYIVKIAGNLREDYEYHSNYVSKLIKELLKEKPKIRRILKQNELFSIVYGKKITDFLKSKGLNSGNKKENNQTIPKWICSNKKYLSACLRGLIDTDGSVHHISKRDKSARISFTSYIPSLINDVHRFLNKLGIKTSKIIMNRRIYISNKSGVNKYTKIIGFSNPKHLRRLQNLQKYAPMV